VTDSLLAAGCFGVTIAGLGRLPFGRCRVLAVAARLLPAPFAHTPIPGGGSFAAAGTEFRRRFRATLGRPVSCGRTAGIAGAELELDELGELTVDDLADDLGENIATGFDERGDARLEVDAGELGHTTSLRR
jgi:hypothetical protein